MEGEHDKCSPHPGVNPRATYRDFRLIVQGVEEGEQEEEHTAGIGHQRKVGGGVHLVLHGTGWAGVSHRARGNHCPTVYTILALNAAARAMEEPIIILVHGRE